MAKKKLPEKRKLKAVNITLEVDQIKHVQNKYDKYNLSKAVRILINKDMIKDDMEKTA